MHIIFVILYHNSTNIAIVNKEEYIIGILPWGIGQITIGERIYVRETQIRG